MSNFANDMTLLISPDAIKALGVFDKNLDERHIKPVIKFVQDDSIQNLIGTRLYQKLLELVASNTICQDENKCYSDLLNGYLKWILTWSVVAQCHITHFLKLRNAGTITIGDTNFSPTSYETMKKVASDYYDKADSYIVKLQRYLSCNCSCFPELRGVEAWWEQSPDKTNGTHSPIYFPRKGGCGC